MSTNPTKWYMRQNAYDDVVTASRVRLSRNLTEFDFKDKIAADDASKLVEKVRSLTPNLAGRECMEYYSCNVYKLPLLEKESLAELQTISGTLVSKTQPTGLIISEDESVSIMINEEDHIRIRAVVSGNNIREAVRIADRVDDYLDSELHYAYSDRYGYLTTCMADTGTGMRASYILSLPALAMSGRIASIQEEIGKFGVAIRPVYGDDNKSAGGFLYEVSNIKTLGNTEQELIENLDQIVGQIVNLEHKRRTAWVENDRDEVADKVFRSYGVLKFTKMINVKDALTLLGQLKLGSDLGLIGMTGNGADLYRLMMEIQPAGIQKLYKCGSEEKEISKARAVHLNRKLPRLSGDDRSEA